MNGDFVSSRLRWILVFSLVTAVSLHASYADELADTIRLCTSCHGEHGLPSDPAIPIIWGQEFYYLYSQMRDYKEGRRSNPIMSGIVQGLTKEGMRALAQHFSEKGWPRTGYKTPDGIEAKAAPALVAGLCVQCHLGGYEGNSRVPRLAGQRTDYLEGTMLDYKNKRRLNSPAMNSLFGAYEDADIAAMARYLGGL
ncbi:MAG: c-type cytochrome [Acidiferrobacterales bacterium]